MIDTIRRTRLNVSAAAIIVFLMGILFVLFPGEIVTGFTQFVGIALALTGLVQFLGKLFSNINKASGMLIGAVIFVIGIWIFVNPISAASILPMVVGVVIVAHSVQNIRLAFIAQNYKMPNWGWMLAGGISSLLCGVVCVVCAFQAISFVVQLSGFMLIFDGIASMLTVQRLNRYEERYIDVEYREL